MKGGSHRKVVYAEQGATIQLCVTLRIFSGEDAFTCTPKKRLSNIKGRSTERDRPAFPKEISEILCERPQLALMGALVVKQVQSGEESQGPVKARKLPCHV
jgi:hypothetical protein